MSINATVFVSTEKTDPHIESFNEKNNCMRLMLSGEGSVSPYVALYGTHGELVKYLSKALAAVLKHSQEMTVTPDEYVADIAEKTGA